MNRLVKAGSTSPKAEFALGTGIGVLGAGGLGGAIGGGDYERHSKVRIQNAMDLAIP
jgi:hypothetical protein